MIKRLILALSLFLVGAPLWASTTYYFVDNTCTYNGNGAPQSAPTPAPSCATSSGGTGPFNSLANAQSGLTGSQPGNSLLLKCGDTFHETYAISSSGGAYGTSSAQFTVGQYGSCTGSNNPIIYGVDTLSASWTTEAETAGASETLGSDSGVLPVGQYSSELYIGTAFPAGATETITAVTLTMRYVGTPGSATLNAYIYTNNSGNPGSQVGTGSSSITESSAGFNGSTDVSITFSSMSASVTYGTEYFVVLHRSTNNSSNYPEWVYMGMSNCGLPQNIGCSQNSNNASSWSVLNSLRGEFTSTVASYNLYYYAPGYTPYGIFYNSVPEKRDWAKDTVRSGFWYWDSTNSRVYIYDNPSGNTVEMANRNGVSITGEGYITVTGLTIERSNNCLYLTGSGAVNITVTGNTLYQCLGYALSEGSGAGGNLLVSGNSISSGVYIGVLLSGGAAGSSNPDVIQGNTITSNRYEPFDLASTYVKVLSNSITNPGATDWGIGYSGGVSCFYVGSGSSHLTIAYNTCTGNTSNSYDGAGVEITAGAYATVEYNLFYGNYGACFEISGTPTNTALYNNTCYNNLLNLNLSPMGATTYRGELSMAGASGAATFTVENNLGYATSTGLSLNKGVAIPTYWSSSGSGLQHGAVLLNDDWYSLGTNWNDWYGTDGSSLSTWQSSSETNTTTEQNFDPKLVNAASNNFRLRMESPACYSGTSVSLTQDILGNAVIPGFVSMGAYQCQPTPAVGAVM